MVVLIVDTNRDQMLFYENLYWLSMKIRQGKKLTETLSTLFLSLFQKTQPNCSLLKVPTIISWTRSASGQLIKSWHFRMLRIWSQSQSWLILYIWMSRPAAYGKSLNFITASKRVVPWLKLRNQNHYNVSLNIAQTCKRFFQD
jgi:hypothetical protein